MSQAQRFLFLQGVRSPFFRRLGRALREAGHYVRKVNFSVGDSFYWRSGNAVAYRGSMDRLKDFYQNEFEEHSITDIVLFGDCRPVHRPAINLARQRDIRVHVYEEGYFRPFWITLERDGVNAHSRLPRDAEWYRIQAKAVPHYDNGEPFSAPFWLRAAYDVGYNIWAGLNPILHPGVKNHVPYSPATEYLGYLCRGIRVKFLAPRSRRIEATLIAEADKSPFYLLPLQLDSDAQIVHHSPFQSMTHAIDRVLESFATQAPKHSRLVVKIHPLDPGLVNYDRYLRQVARINGIADRIFYLETGNLPALLSAAKGVITVNSTVGSSSLIHGRPTIALGWALYDIPGLTFQGSLDSFWEGGQAPDGKLFHNFRDTVINHTQINGGFYSKTAIDKAIFHSLPRLLQPSSVQESKSNIDTLSISELESAQLPRTTN
ncbi:capsular biosynthesis protein [Achromobacter sp. HZ01]|uniref:capsule biosynthesis protein n=1 Tax=Achromobacter sp. HZ01 TaxID=1416886 RepID=UPI000DCFAD58|nr:capsular biosynthesis protein [Achromobacter sp. HZ01]